MNFASVQLRTIDIPTYMVQTACRVLCEMALCVGWCNIASHIGIGRFDVADGSGGCKTGHFHLEWDTLLCDA